MHAHISPYLLWPIILGYLVIAWQARGLASAFRGKAPDVEPMTPGELRLAQRSMLALMAVFILCAISSYVPAALAGVFVFPLWEQYLSHTLLIIATWTFIFTGGSRALMRAFR